MILVHICCSVDSHYFLQHLRKQYPQYKIVGYFYNPNIHPKIEYDLRLLDVKRSCEMLDIELFEGDYNTQDWFSSITGLEEEPEKGARCVVCFDSRLIHTAKFAQEKNIDTFTTTLLSSPMKEQEILFAQGDKIAQAYNLKFIKIDVRSNGGTQEQAQLAKKDNLYRQNYCGCNFALIKQRNTQGKVAFELLESVGRQFLPASNEDRMHTFARRNILEADSVPYILAKRSIIAWRNLRSMAQCGEDIIDIYVLADSKSKRNNKTGKIVWIQTEVLSPLVLQHFFCQPQHKKFAEVNINSFDKCYSIMLGVASKDDCIFICLDDINKLCGTHYKNIRELNATPLPYELENALRVCLCGLSSINPIIILDSRKESNMRIFIQSIFQEENVFRLIEGIK